MKAIWNGITIAESAETIVVEGNHYFPPDAIQRAYFEESARHTTCPWKGVASYYNLVADGRRSENAAWYYPNPSAAAQKIENYVAFYPVVAVVAE